LISGLIITITRKLFSKMKRFRGKSFTATTNSHFLYWHRIRFVPDFAFLFFSVQLFSFSVGSILKRIIEKKLQFITLLTATCIVSHIENSKNDKGYIT